MLHHVNLIKFDIQVFMTEKNNENEACKYDLINLAG